MRFRRHPPEPSSARLVMVLLNFVRHVNRYGIRSERIESAYEDVVYELNLYLYERDELRERDVTP